MQASGHFRVDAAGIRALGHPLRMRILEALRAGPATSTMLARELRESTGATSYHLRALARYGFIEEVAGRGRGRERWWRRPETARWIVGDHAVDGRAAGMSTVSLFVADDERALARFVAEEPMLDDEWRDAATIVGWNVVAAPADIRRLADAIGELVDELRREPPADARAKPVHVTFRVLPQPEPPTSAGDGAVPAE